MAGGNAHSDGGWPGCRWKVVVDDDTPTLPVAGITSLTRLAAAAAATVRFPPLRHGPTGPGPTGGRP